MIRSKIREKNTTKRVLQSLGLKKIGQTRTYNYNDAVMGMVKKIIHLLKYEIIEVKEEKKEIRGSRLEASNKGEKKETVKKPTAKAKKPAVVKKPQIAKETEIKKVKKSAPKANKTSEKKEDSDTKKTKEVKKPAEKKIEKQTDEKPKAEKVDGGKDETQ